MILDSRFEIWDSTTLFLWLPINFEKTICCFN